MDYLECLSGRRSVRKYKGDNIPRDVLERIITTASYAPSWKNSQTTRYIVVENEELKTQLAQDCMMDFTHNQNIVTNAPAVILVTTITNRSGYERDGSFSTDLGTHWESFDAGIATQTLCLAAYAEGLGSVILGIFDPVKVGGTVTIPESQKLSAIVAIGYPDEFPDMPKRKSSDEIADYKT